MLAEAYIENNEMRVINFPKDAFMKAKHWKINIEPIEAITDKDNKHDKLQVLDDLLLNIKDNLDPNVKKMTDKELLAEALKGKI